MISWLIEILKNKLRQIDEYCNLREFRLKYTQVKSQLERVPPELLRQEVIGILSEKAHFNSRVSVPAPEERRILDKLHPSIRQIFEKYQYLYPVNAHTVYSREKIGPSVNAAGYMRIAWSMDYTEIVARPGKEPVYQIDGTEKSSEEYDSYPSIYHWILLEEWIACDDDFLVTDFVDFAHDA